MPRQHAVGSARQSTISAPYVLKAPQHLRFTLLDNQSEKFCYSVDAAASLMSIGRRSLYRQIAEGRLKTVKIGRRTVIPSGAIRDFLAAAIEAASKPIKAAA